MSDEREFNSENEQRENIVNATENAEHTGNSENVQGTGAENTAEHREEQRQYSQYNYSSQTGSSMNGGTSRNNNNRKAPMGTGAKVALVLGAAAVFGVFVGIGGYTVKGMTSSGNAAAEVSEAAAADAAEEEQEAVEIPRVTLQTSDNGTSSASIQAVDVADIVEEAMPSIVSVYNSYTAKTQDFFGQIYTQEAEATGSGIIIGKSDTELLIVTNNHVIADADSLKVQFINGTECDALVKGADEDNDLAVIAIKLDDIDDDTMDSISIATIGDSDSLRVGEPAIAIGNALGYGQSVTTGVISALNRQIGTTSDESEGDTSALTYIQTDAAINPGNSGGALLNSKGEVIGINSNKIGATTVEGMCYAIPTSRAKPIIEELMNEETREKVAEDNQGYLGISGVSVTEQVATAYNMPQGVYIAELIEGSGAAQSDLQKGDIITKVDGKEITGMDELKTELSYHEAGTEVTLTVERSDGKEYSEVEVPVTLGTKEVLNGAEKN